MIPVVFASMIHDSYKNLPPDSWFTKTSDYLLIKWFSQGQLSLVLYIIWCSNFCFIQTWYHHSFCLGMEVFVIEQLEKQADCQPRMHELYRGPGACSPEKFLKIGLSKTPYPAFPGSNAINSYVYFIELFSESRYSWFPSRSTKIHDSQVFKTKIHDSYMFCNYGSWFMIPLSPPSIDKRDWKANLT